MVIDIFLAPAVFVIVGVLPTYVGLFLLVLIAKRGNEGLGKFVASIAAGISFALFFDLVGNASGLGLNIGLRASGTQILLLSSFVIGLLLLFALDAKSTKIESVPISLAYIIALGISFHSFAEGIVTGYDIRTTGFPQEVSTMLQGISFALHKAGEGFVIAAPFAKSMNLAKGVSAGAIASLPGILGALLGTFGIPGIVSSYFFALGAGAIIYTITKMIPVAVSQRSSIKTAIGIVIGYIFIYGAGIMHTI